MAFSNVLRKEVISLVAVTFPLVLSLVWPRSHGPSLTVTPFIMGMIVAAIAGWTFQPKGSLGVALWLMIVVGIIALSPASEMIMVMAAVGAALVAYICISLGFDCSKNEHLLRAIIFALTLGMVINSAVAWMQFFDVEIFGYPWVSQNDSPRPYGNLRQANHLASICTIGLVSTWWLLQRQLIGGLVATLIAFMAYSALSMTGSRIGFIEVIVVSLLLMTWQQNRKKINMIIFGFGPVWLAILVVGLPLLSQLMGGDLETIGQRNSSSIAARIELWRAAWEIAISHPVQGVGWGEFRYASFVALPVINGVENASNAHNLPLHLISELGFAGAFLILAPVVWILLRKHLWWEAQASVRWALLVVVVVGLHSLVEYPLWYLNFLIPTAIAFGLLISQGNLESKSGNTTLLRREVRMCSLVLMVASVIFLYDYSRVAGAFNENDRAFGDSDTLSKAQKTWFFDYYADRAIADSIPVTQSNAPQMLDITERLMHEGPNPLVFWSRLAALCISGGGYQARELAEDFQRRFPEAHAEFKKLASGDSYMKCIQ